MSEQTNKRELNIKRPVVSDLDGTQQGGLAFCVALLSGSVVAASLAPGSLTSFWVWFALLTASVSIALGVQKLFAQVAEDDAE